jgi:hypothetical protein
MLNLSALNASESLKDLTLRALNGLPEPASLMDICSEDAEHVDGIRVRWNIPSATDAYLVAVFWDNCISIYAMNKSVTDAVLDWSEYLQLAAWLRDFGIAV